MENINKIAVSIEPNINFLKEGKILSEHNRLTDIQFGINDIKTWGRHMFILKENLVKEYKNIKQGDIMYIIINSRIYEVEILFLIKNNNFNEEIFVAKCNPNYYENSEYIYKPISKLINTKKEAEHKCIILEIEYLEKMIKQHKIELKKLKLQKNILHTRK